MARSRPTCQPAGAGSACSGPRAVEGQRPRRHRMAGQRGHGRPRCPRRRQRVGDQEDEAGSAVGRLPAVRWPIIEAAVPLPPIIAELPMSLSIWG